MGSNNYDIHLFNDLRRLVDSLDMQELRDRAAKKPHRAVCLRFREHDFWVKPSSLDKGDLADKIARMYYHRVKGYDVHSSDLAIDNERIPERYRQQSGLGRIRI